MNDIAIETGDNQVCRAENGRFIGFWRGQIVSKYDGGLRYFDSEEAARNFLAHRDAAGSSILGISRSKIGLSA